uniref:Uncharacterized protein n=1 Tax=Rhizophora mucronata TaxID=61149 RepID=A0A2P2KS51_RHIMU
MPFRQRLVTRWMTWSIVSF